MSARRPKTSPKTSRKTSRKKGTKRVKRRPATSLGSSLVIARVGKSKSMTRPDEVVAVMLPRAGRALSEPGIRKREVVFRNLRSGKRILAYSVDPDDPTKIIQESPDGTRKTGRLVRGKFKA